MFSSSIPALPIRFLFVLLTALTVAACQKQAGKLLPPAQTDTKTQENAKAADILANVRTHILLAEEPKPTVAEILDVATLRARNAFYANAANGDYLIVTTTRAILYSPSKDRIIDVMTVQLERTTPVEAPQMQQ